MDIYLEPVLPPPRLVLYGDSPAARALSQLGAAMGYSVETAGAVRPGGRLYAVVATMGENDEDSVIAALEARPAYLGVVASRKRFAELRESLLARGVSADALASIRNPAGLDIGARLPEEVALSILAEIVQLARAAAVAEAPPAEPEEIDPVCGMTVIVAAAHHRAEHGGRSYYFCNPRCREKFLADPARYLAPMEKSG